MATAKPDFENMIVKGSIQIEAGTVQVKRHGTKSVPDNPRKVLITQLAP
jgi:hypothetical protein